MLFTIIIPIHYINEAQGDRLLECVKSLANQREKNFTVLFLSPASVKDEYMLRIAPECKGFTYVWHTHEETDNYQHQVNYAVANLIKTEYFSVLQYDDTALPDWTRLLSVYGAHFPKASVLMPFVLEKNNRGETIGFTNEIAYSKDEFLDEGVLDKTNLLKKKYMNLSLVGAFYKTLDFARIGGLKTSMRWFFDREFILRSLQQGLELRVIPKFGHVHTNDLEESMFNLDYKPMDQHEKTFWFERSEIESIYDYDRQINYSQPVTGA